LLVNREIEGKEHTIEVESEKKGVWSNVFEDSWHQTLLLCLPSIRNQPQFAFLVSGFNMGIGQRRKAGFWTLETRILAPKHALVILSSYIFLDQH